MASRPGRILIRDLRQPVLTADQVELMAEAERNPVVLDEQAVLDAAVEHTGLRDFGPPDFRERLRLILAEVDENRNATALVRATYFNKTVAVAANRLLARDLLLRHPEIEHESVERPIIVAGLPRSGTTHLLGLLSADDRLRSLPYWESLQPIPLPGEACDTGGVDPRYLRARRGWERLQRINPMMAPYHPMDPDHIHEDLELQLADFSSYFWEWPFRLPGWRDYYLAHDQTRHYRYERTMLKIMSWQDGVSRRWVLKCPQHFEQLPSIMEVFPDAVVVFTHRDPIASLASIVTQMAYVIRTREHVIDPDYYLEYWTERVERLLQAYARDVESVPASQRVHVPFAELLGELDGMLERIYAAAGVELNDAARANIAVYRRGHVRGKYGEIDHDLRRDFGVDLGELRERFAFYTRRPEVGG
jgi:hypothetical protein